jgi:shikimate dehydrogenase
VITGTTKLLGVIGHPVEHSLSPAMHNAALANLGLNYVYLPFPIKPEDLETAIKGFAAVGVVGFSITIPHKQTIIPLLSEISPLAQAVGAVNTVIRKNDQWIGTNTDVEGFLAPLQTTYKRDWSNSVALILGNGGAARAVVAGCSQLGCKSIYVVGRNPDKLEDFRKSWANSGFGNHLSVCPWDEIPELIPQTSLLVNTTPLGMHPNTNQSPLTKEEIKLLVPGSIAYDLIYIPSPTQFLHQAEKQGAIAIDGLSMLVNQGAAALKMWLGVDEVPVEIMEEALIQKLGLKN